MKGLKASFDNGIAVVSKYRAYLGAIENRLAHAESVVSNSSENTSASESRIRDLDMAKGMMEYSKESILQQSSQAMLAQAKGLGEGILQLLK